MVLLLAAFAFANGLPERSYERAVDLVDGLYLYPDQVDATELLGAAASRLADEVHWLRIETQGPAVNLQHGDGTLIGSVSVANVATLPAALASLEDLVRGAGYPLDDLDVRLTLLQGMTDGLDRYSRVLSGDGLDRFDVRLKGTLVGVGIGLRIAGDQLLVSRVNPKGPADRAGLRANDRITRIDGRSTVNMPTREANRKIRGEEGTAVELVVDRAGKAFTFTVQRAEIVVPNVESKVLAGNVGYVRISHMSQRTVENLAAELESLATKGALAHGLVLDLRRNTGGSMKESARSVDEFVDAGLLLRTAGHDGGQVRNLQARMDAEPGGRVPDVPVVVVVDERTASGAEILAGSLLELDRAVLVGTRTYGKGTVQKIYPLGDEVRMKLTVAQYILENDRRIADGGLVPDQVIGRIVLDSYGVHHPDAHEGTADQRLPWVVERWGWREHEAEEVDLPEELARRAVLASKGSSRAETLVALRAAAATLATEQTTTLAGALASQGIDWASGPVVKGSIPVDAHVTLEPDPDREDVLVLTGTVTNRDPERTLFQTALELQSSFSGWDGLSLPIGRLEAGASLSGSVRVPLRRGIREREDEVQVVVRTLGREPFAAGSAVLTAKSTPHPRLEASVRLDGEGSTRKAVVALKNLSSVELSGLEVHFAYPGDIDVELLDRASRVPLLAAGGTHTFGLDVALGDSLQGAVPLRLEVETPSGRSLARWPVDVPLDGTPIMLRPPHVATVAHPPRALAGSVEVPIVVRDDRALDHVVVHHNGRKVAWAAGAPLSVSFVVRTELVPGANRFEVVAVDDQGLSTQDRFVIRGLPTDGVATP